MPSRSTPTRRSASRSGPSPAGTCAASDANRSSIDAEPLAGALVGVGDDPGLEGRGVRPAVERGVVREAGHRVVPDRRRQLREPVGLEPGRRPVAMAEVAGHPAGGQLVDVVEEAAASTAAGRPRCPCRSARAPGTRRRPPPRRRGARTTPMGSSERRTLAASRRSGTVMGRIVSNGCREGGGRSAAGPWRDTRRRRPARHPAHPRRRADRDRDRAQQWRTGGRAPARRRPRRGGEPRSIRCEPGGPRQRGRPARSRRGDGDALVPEVDLDRPVLVRPVHARAARSEAAQRRARRVAVLVVRARRDDRDPRPHRVEERLRRRGRAPVVGDLENVDTREAAGEQRRVDPLLDVARQQEPAPVGLAEQHDRRRC